MTNRDRDELLRALLALIIGDTALYPSVKPGHALGSLHAQQAAQFAQLVDLYNGSGLAAWIDDDGHLRLKHLAA